MILIKRGKIFGPAPLGIKDILIGGNKILAIEKTIDPKTLPGEIRVVDAKGMVVVPGFIDGHQHFTGGGGEGGFQSRTPEMQISTNIANGVTTAVGLLGTDALTRTVESLYAKTCAFNAEGMTAFMLTGSYWLPSPTICGSVARDITYIKPVIGVKLAMADHRGPCYDAKELSVLASSTRVASLVAGKPGIITVHAGANPDGLDLIFEAADRHGIRPETFIPTHVNRKNSKVADQALKLAENRGFIDATCRNKLPDPSDHSLSAADFACMADDQGLFGQVCFSSDAGGSLPRWDKDRSRILGMGIGTPSSLLSELKRLVQDHGMDLEKALAPLTTTPARALGLAQKGTIAKGCHADLLVLDQHTLEIRDVLAKGCIMMHDRLMAKKGYFE